MERLAARMGGTRKWAYNNSECLDADFFKVIQDSKCTQKLPKIYTMLHNCVDYANFTIITAILLRLKNILYYCIVDVLLCTSSAVQQFLILLQSFRLLQIVADQLVKTSGIRPLLHCMAVDAIMDGNKIKV